MRLGIKNIFSGLIVLAISINFFAISTVYGHVDPPVDASNPFTEFSHVHYDGLSENGADHANFLPTNDHMWPLGGITGPIYPIAAAYNQRDEDMDENDAHRGIDIQVPLGTPVYAMADGVVRRARNNYYSDPMIQITHFKPGYDPSESCNHSINEYKCYYSNYMHLPEDSWIGFTSEGSTVTKGQQIAVSGGENSNVEHLHFEFRNGGTTQPDAINPMLLLPYNNTANNLVLEFKNDNDVIEYPDFATDGDIATSPLYEQRGVNVLLRSLHPNEVDANRVEIKFYDRDSGSEILLDQQVYDIMEHNYVYTDLDVDADGYDDDNDRDINGYEITPWDYNANDPSREIWVQNYRFHDLDIYDPINESIPNSWRVEAKAFDVFGVENSMIEYCENGGIQVSCDSPFDLEVSSVYQNRGVLNITLTNNSGGDFDPTTDGFRLYLKKDGDQYGTYISSYLNTSNLTAGGGLNLITSFIAPGLHTYEVCLMSPTIYNGAYNDADISNNCMGNNFNTPDSDNDGLSDDRETFSTRTNPNLADTDGGGVDDGTEVLVDRTDPNHPGDDNNAPANTPQLNLDLAVTSINSNNNYLNITISNQSGVNFDSVSDGFRISLKRDGVRYGTYLSRYLATSNLTAGGSLNLMAKLYPGQHTYEICIIDPMIINETYNDTDTSNNCMNAQLTL